MAVPPIRLLTPAEAAQIPSRTLPINSQLLHLLNEFTSLSLSLLSALASASVIPTVPVYTQLAALDKKLSALLLLAVQHQQLQLQITQLSSSITRTEQAWRNGTHGLHKALSELDPIVESGARDKAAIEAADPENGVLTPATILSYARLLAPFTSAPPSSLFPPEKRKEQGVMDPSGRGLPPGAFPPFPTEGTMRRGRLQFGKDGLGELGETEDVGVRKTNKKDPAAAMPAQPAPLQQLEQHATNAGGPSTAVKDDFAFELDLDLN